MKSKFSFVKLYVSFTRERERGGGGVSPLSAEQVTAFGLLARTEAQEGVKKPTLSAGGWPFRPTGCRRTLYLQEKRRPCRLMKVSCRRREGDVRTLAGLLGTRLSEASLWLGSEMQFCSALRLGGCHGYTGSKGCRFHVCLCLSPLCPPTPISNSIFTPTTIGAEDRPPQVFRSLSQVSS